MKKLTVLIAVFATLVGNSAFAQQTTQTQPMTKPAGRGAQAAKKTASDKFAWGIGLGALAVLGVVVGVVAASAASDSSTFSH